jgi:formylglycine-generating enzyme required for sulfatase activity
MPPPPTQSWLEGLEEREEDFDVAQLVALPPLQTNLVTAAWFKQEKLQRISFRTARLAAEFSPGRVVASPREPQLVLMEPSTAAAVTALIGLPDGRFAAASASATISIWDPASGSSSAVLRGHRDGVFALALLPNGWLASGSSDCTIRLWDLASGSCLAEFEGHQGGVQALAVLPDGRLASGSTDSTIRILDPATGRLAPVIEGHASGVHALAVLPDGRLASGAGDWSVRLWDPASGIPLAVFEGHQRRVNALAVLPDGRLASGSDDHTIRLWDASTGTCLAVYQGHQAEIRALVMVAAGWLASGAQDGEIRLWDLASGDCVQILKGNGGEEEILAGSDGSVESLLLLADGRLVSSANDRRIRIWGTHSDILSDIASRPESVADSSLQEASAWGFHEPLQRDHLPFGATAARPDPLALTLVEIAAGSFLMGSPPNEPERSEDEGPQHEVTLTSFFISQTPITQGQWRAVAQWQPLPAERWGRQLDPEPSFFQPRSNPKAGSFGDIRFSLLEGETDSEQRPVDNVSWLEAIEFCSRLSQRTGRHYTLPSEAQWEYACRAGTTTAFHFGATITPELANYDGTLTYADGPKGEYRMQTTPVGMFPANAWGLLDMHGNVWEWCLDHWHASYRGAPSDGSAWLNLADKNFKAATKGGVEKSSDEDDRLLRGGSWSFIPGNCRSAYRFHDLPGDADDDVGFRVVCLPQGPSLNP